MRIGMDCIGVGVGAVISDGKGKYFASQRGPQSRNEIGLWEFPGGAVEFGDTLEDAIKREIREEFGIEIQVGELLGVCNHLLPEEHQHWVSPSFLCTVLAGTPRILEPEKCSAIGWFSIEEIYSMPITVVTRQDVLSLRKKFPPKIPHY